MITNIVFDMGGVLIRWDTATMLRQKPPFFSPCVMSALQERQRLPCYPQALRVSCHPLQKTCTTR